MDSWWGVSVQPFRVACVGHGWSESVRASIGARPLLPSDVSVLWLDCQLVALEVPCPSLVGAWGLTVVLAQVPGPAPGAVLAEGTPLPCCTWVSGAPKKGEKPIFPIWVTLHFALWHDRRGSRVPGPRSGLCFMKPFCSGFVGSHSPCLSSDNQ